jgi:hypothetical protein
VALAGATIPRQQGFPLSFHRTDACRPPDPHTDRMPRRGLLGESGIHFLPGDRTTWYV